MLTTRSSSGLAAYRREVLSLSPAAWFRAGDGQTVTGSGVSTWADQSGNGRDLLQGTDANRPVSLDHSGTNYLFLPGGSASYASTGDYAALNLTGDVEVIFRHGTLNATNEDYMSVGLAAGQKQFGVAKAANNLRFTYTTDGTTVITANSTSTYTTPNIYTSKGWVRVTYNKTTGDVNFYTSSTDTNDPALVSWSQLGATVSTAGGQIHNGNQGVYVGIGLVTGGATQNMYRMVIRDGIGGTDVFNADFTAQVAGTASFSEGSANAATVTFTTGIGAQIVGRSSVLMNGFAHFLKCGAFTLDQPSCVIAVKKQVSWTLNDVAWDGNTAGTMQLVQSATTPRIRANAGSATTENAGLAVGTVGVVAAVYNGASSFTRVNNNANVTGDAGAGNAGGFTLGANATPGSYFNGQFYEVIILPIAPSTAQLDRIVAQLMAIYSVS